MNQTRVCCLKDQVVSNCYNECSANTCANVKNPPQVCTLECALNVCVCGPNLFLNECNECVEKSQCYVNCKKSKPIKCKGPFETLYGCFKSKEARVCPQIKYSRPRDVFSQYTSTDDLCVLNVCDCTNGFLRNKCGECVLPEDCGKKCHKIACEEPHSEVRTVYSKRKCKKDDCAHDKCETNCKDDACRSNCNKKRSKCKKCRIARHVCVCKVGYARNKCGVCVPAHKAFDNVPCACTNPCNLPGQEWHCYNECNRPSCQNYYDLPTKICPKACDYGCFCSANQGLWFNGTACVPGLMCPPRNQLPTLDPISEVVEESNK